MILLTDVQIKLAEQLLLTVVKKEPMVTYSELAERINPPIHHRNVGKNIGEISKLCHQLGLPLLSVKVVNKYSQNVGTGFFDLCHELGINVSSSSERELCKQELKKIRECTEWYKLAEYLGLDIPLDKPFIEIYPDEISEKDATLLFEGRAKKVTINVYERNAEARNLCIQKHGCSCTVCGINFKTVYGQLGENFIHVHHIIPLHKIKKGYMVDGEKDLIPVCPNCHAMLHKEINGQCLSVDELIEIVKKNRL
ncbi:MAG: HNH endonuclease [Parabacteroides sp.]|nr:HNH endonuclease [Parabacteroides sp.]